MASRKQIDKKYRDKYKKMYGEKFKQERKIYNEMYYKKHRQNKNRKFERWSISEEDLIKKHCYSDVVLSNFLGRSVMAIQVKRSKIKSQDENIF